MAFLNKFIETVDALEEIFIQRLSELVSIPSVSLCSLHRPDVFKAADYIYQLMKQLGIDVEKRFLGTQIMEGQEIDLPPVVLGKYGNDKNKKTVLLYGHFDVQPAFFTDGWNTDPWKLVYDEKTDCMYGRGATDDKGPLLGWLNTVEAFQKAGIDIPVNLVFCFEGMEENGSHGLHELIQKEADKYFADIDCVCISDNYWLGTKKPCLTYGLRGISSYVVTITGPPADLHSGIFGGFVNEPMTDLVKLLSSIVDSNGTILIPGIMDKVVPLTAEEEALYDDISITMDDLYYAVGSKTIVYDDTKSVLMHRWRYPSLSLHGIEGAYSEAGVKTVIPAKVSGKFSIRLVPNMNCEETYLLVKKHLESVFASLGSKNVFTLDVLHGSEGWLSSIKHWNYQAASKATEKVYGVIPDYTREGGSIPVTLTFDRFLKKNVLLLPMGRADDGPHSINEKLNKSNYIQGIKLFGTYLCELSAF